MNVRVSGFRGIIDAVAWSETSGGGAGHDCLEQPCLIFGFFAKLSELTQGTLRQDVHDMLANDEHVVALLDVSAERDDMRMEDHQVRVAHIENGKLMSFWGVPEDQAGWDRFYG